MEQVIGLVKLEAGLQTWWLAAMTWPSTQLHSSIVWEQCDRYPLTRAVTILSASPFISSNNDVDGFSTKWIMMLMFLNQVKCRLSNPFQTRPWQYLEGWGWLTVHKELHNDVLSCVLVSYKKHIGGSWVVNSGVAHNWIVFSWKPVYQLARHNAAEMDPVPHHLNWQMS